MKTIYFHGNRKLNQVALTFDDGPCKRTESILKILKKEKVSATFFVCGNKVIKNKKIILRAIKQNCEIGNHSYNHVLTVFKSRRKILEEIERTDEALKQAGVKTNLFRPPYFLFGITVFSICKSLGKKIIETDNIGYDWRFKEKEVIRKILRKTKNGSIINLHDYLENIGENKEIVAIVKTLIKELKIRGYSFVTVSEIIRK